jgi:hypothetical protein
VIERQWGPIQQGFFLKKSKFKHNLKVKRDFV